MDYNKEKSIIFSVHPYLASKSQLSMAHSSFMGFVDFIPELLKSEPIKLFQLSYNFVYDLVVLSENDVFTIDQIIKKLVFMLLKEGLWSWNIPEIAKKITDYLSKKDGVKKIDLGSLHEQLFSKVKAVLEKEGHSSVSLTNLIVNEMIFEIEKEGPKTSIEKIISKLRHRFELANLSNEIVDGCVNEFIELMFDKGCIFFTE